MKGYALFKFSYLFSDHMAKASPEARLLYINMNFHAENGFVPNPRQLLDQMGLDHSYLDELVSLDEVLTIPDREEVFITAFFVHNKGANPRTWWNTPYGIYWQGKLSIKKNRIATLKPIKEAEESLSANVIEESDPEEDGVDISATWDELMDNMGVKN